MTWYVVQKLPDRLHAPKPDLPINMVGWRTSFEEAWALGGSLGISHTVRQVEYDPFIKFFTEAPGGTT